MARRRGGEAEVDNVKKKEEIDMHRTVYIDTNLDTHFALVASEFDSVLHLKKKVMLEHLQCFPTLGEIVIHALKVKRKGHFYHLSDSMRINSAFEGVKSSWFLSVDASCMKQSCRPNMSNQLPMLCLPHNLTNAGCNNDDALQDNSGLFCKSTEKTSKQESILPEVQYAGGIIASNTVSPDSTDADHLPLSLRIENMKSKRKRHDMTLSSADNHERAIFPSSVKDSSIEDRVKENNILSNHVTGEVERKTSKEETILPEDHYNNQIIASKTISSESTDADQMPLRLRIDNMKSKKRKMHEMNLSSAENHKKPSLLSVKDSSMKDKVKEKNIPLNHVTGEVLSAHEILDPSNLLLDTERKEHKEIEDSPKETEVPLSTPKEVFELPRNSEGQNDSQKIVLGTLSSEPADNQHLKTSPTIKSKRGEKKRKKDVKVKKDVAFNLPSVVGWPLSVQDAGGEESLQEKHRASNDVSGEIREDESPHEVTVPMNLVVNAKRTEHEGNSGDPLKENQVLVSINGTSTQEIRFKDNSMENRHNDQKVVVDTLSSAAADNDHLRTGTSTKSKKDKKKRKTYAKINISNSTVLPSSARDAVGAESLNDTKRTSNYVSAKDEARTESTALANLLVDRERIECEKIGNSSKQDKNLFSSSKKTSTRGTGLTGKTVEDQSIVVFGTSFPEPAESEHLRTNSSIKHKKSKKKSKKDAAFSLSSAVVLPSSAHDVGEESYKEKNIALNNVSGKDESLPKIQDQDNSQKVVLDTLCSELADSEHLGTNSNIDKMKKKKKRKMVATITLPSANVLPSSVQHAVGEECLKEKIIPSHEDESHHEIAVSANLLVNTESPEREEISGDTLIKDKVGFNAPSTTIGLNLDRNTAQTSTNENSVNVQSADMIKDKTRKDQANFNIQSQPAVSESGSDRIDFKHYFLPRKAEDNVAASDKNGITRSERDDITEKSTNKITASLITSHEQAPTLQSSKNQEGGVKSHIICSSRLQESFSQDVSSRSLRSSKKSTSNVYRKGLPSSFEPDQARTPHSVLRASGRGVSVNSTPAPAYRKGKKVSSAASSSTSESSGKSHPGTKSKKLVSNADRRLVACAKGSAEGTSEVKSRTLHKKSLLITPGFIFKDDSSESSDHEGAGEQFHARTPSDDVSSSDSDRDSQISLDSLKKASGSGGLDKKEDVVNIEKKRSSNSRPMGIDMILRSSSRYKKAKLTAESQPEVEDFESEPVDCVPDSQANP
ncbi:hypothetical protein POM88_021585 [Heracleum sosnowskyi]|uniref:Uncharacterized protein n=1 Tax=Heracleum sosnowskyi TaxID=360622 RepID=A0AAD8MP02_9APIA|nr:hypothetical protein POM88_021585 [Heracleum sosnowskyi]